MRPSIATVEETRLLERSIIEDLDVPVEVLMERAALGVAGLVRELVGANPVPLPSQALGSSRQDLHPPEVAVLAGAGHNGGDAIACARILSGWGIPSPVYLAPGELGPTVAAQVKLAKAHGVQFQPLAEFRGASRVVDGLFGFGLNRAPQGVVLEAIERANASQPRFLVAIDLPSGTHGDTGAAPGVRIAATHTVATGPVKLGCATDLAADWVGELWAADLGFPSALMAGLKGRILHWQPLPTRSKAAHKGTGGTLLVIGGSNFMSGAPALVAQAAARSGAGLVVVGVPDCIRDVVATLVPEALVVPLPTDTDGLAGAAALSAISHWLERASALAIGPGLGPEAGAAELVRELLGRWDKPAVIDADALLPACELAKLKLANDTGSSSFRQSSGWVLTPHPGEASRLLGTSAADVQADRLLAARRLAQATSATVVLKGARSIVARPDRTYAVLLRTSPALATAGSGDVLCGIIGGLLAQGHLADRAAELGVSWHAELGLAAAPGPSGLLARDLVNYSSDLGKPFCGPHCVGSTTIRLA